MPGYSLHPGIHHCVSNGYSIIFDLNLDRYFALNADAHLALEHLKSGDVSEGDELTLERLCSRAILRKTEDQPWTALDPIVAAPADDYRSYPATGSAMLFPVAIVRQLQALIALRYLPLAKCLHGVARRKAALVKSEDPGRRAIAFEVAATFRSAEALLSSHNRCLARSIAITNHLSRNGCWSNLVIGVSARPFRAHAWVQVGPIVLNDLIDHVRLYTPICAL